MKSALAPSWGTVLRMVLQVCDTAPLVQAGSDSVLDRDARSSDKLVLSLTVPSWRISRDEPTLSRASLVSRMATADRTWGRKRRTLDTLVGEGKIRIGFIFPI